MQFTRSCRYSTKAELLFCLSFFLLLLRGVYSSREQLPYNNMELKEFLSPDTNPDIYNIMTMLREIIQKHQHKENVQWTGDDNGEDLSETQTPLKFIPIPMLRKKGTYMGPCHFKVCNMG